MSLLWPSALGKYRRERPDNYHMWLCFLGWLGLFAVGVSAPSEPFRTVLVSILMDTKSAAGVHTLPAEPGPADPPATPGPALARAALQPQTAGPLTSAFPFHEAAPLEPLPATPATGWSWPMRLAMIAPLVLATFITFTPTNLLLLCCFGAALGSYAVRLIPYTVEADAARNERAEPPGVPAVIAMLHGLIVFAAAVAGLIVVQGEFQWDQTRGDLYLRLAATVTIFSIAAGTNRHFVRDLAQAFMPFRGGFGNRGPGPAPSPRGGGLSPAPTPAPAPGPGGGPAPLAAAPGII